MQLFDAHVLTNDLVGLTSELEGLRKVNSELKKVDKGLLLVLEKLNGRNRKNNAFHFC